MAKWHLSRHLKGEEENQVVSVLIWTITDILDFYHLCSFKCHNLPWKKTLDPAGAAAPIWMEGRIQPAIHAGAEHQTLDVLHHRFIVWMSLHHRFIVYSRVKESEVIFIGDSLVQLMQQCKIWKKLFSPLHALNFVIGGDSTQHVLWWLENEELEQIHPKIVVVWVGTNNQGTQQMVTGEPRTAPGQVEMLRLLPRSHHPNLFMTKNSRWMSWSRQHWLATHRPTFWMLTPVFCTQIVP